MDEITELTDTEVEYNRVIKILEDELKSLQKRLDYYEGKLGCQGHYWGLREAKIKFTTSIDKIREGSVKELKKAQSLWDKALKMEASEFHPTDFCIAYHRAAESKDCFKEVAIAQKKRADKFEADRAELIGLLRKAKWLLEVDEIGVVNAVMERREANKLITAIEGFVPKARGKTDTKLKGGK